MLNIFKKKPDPSFPPVPAWRPTIHQPLESIIERARYYTDDKRDFAVFKNGTCVFLSEGLSDSEAIAEAKEVLSQIFNYHSDMNPNAMDDGNIMVSYNHPAVNIVLEEFAQNHWAEIDRNHQRALAKSEVLMTPFGANVFDDLGKKALFGRCFMFMDAQNPNVVQIVRGTQI